ncbi:MAG: hypothetical protein GY703_25535 [Gammaproteobacteria bacterium]|nr:hypothetical protein [Gammaproteobacteria bacterium]
MHLTGNCILWWHLSVPADGAEFPGKVGAGLCQPVTFNKDDDDLDESDTAESMEVL